ncbi:hypothetical protein [Paenibacillus taichungensis]|uniref:hypothetical protein n=1 Tax=Paenibacillus taichungensis TaxID=484184 RepID=UPI0035D650B6
MIIKLKHSAAIGPLIPDRFYYAEPADPQGGVEQVTVLRWEDKSEHLCQMSQVEILPERLSIIAYVLAWSEIPAGECEPHILFRKLPEGKVVLTGYANEVRDKHRNTIDQIIRDVYLTALVSPQPLH